AAKAARLGVAPYDALLDQYDPGRRSADVERLFADLEAFLPGLLGKVLDRQARSPAPRAPSGPFPLAAQRELVERLASVLGFDFRRGRLDVSLHPFSGG